MNPSMSAAWVREVWKRTIRFMADPAASSTAWTFSKACLVWAATSPGPIRRPARSIPTCPATTTISPPGEIMPCEYIPSVGPSVFDLTGFTRPPPPPGSAEANVLEVARLAVDAARRRGDPVRHLPPLGHRLHQATHVGRVLLGGQPVAMARVPLRLAHDPAVRGDLDFRERADGAAEAAVREREGEVDPVALDDLVPAVHAALAVGDVVVPEALVQRDEGRLLATDDAVAVEG